MANLDARKLQALIRDLPQLKARLLDAAAEAIVTDVKTSFNTSPPGREYQRRTVRHVASQAGFPPNVDTGTLRASIRAVRQGDNVRWIMDGVEYGVILELGSSRMVARPFMSPAFRRFRERWPQFVRDFYEGAIK
jgi:hypothetical protein